MKWKNIESHPKDEQPFWLGTQSGGVMMEAWHWCTLRNDFAGLLSERSLSSLKQMAPTEKFLWTEMQAPKPQR